MIKYFFFIAILCNCIRPATALAQGENNVWAFGVNTGLDFNTPGGPSLIKTAIQSWESCGTVCDADGQLLFYNGFSRSTYDGLVWDKTHKLMPNGSGLLGNFASSASQGVSIIPFQDGTERYYLFIQSAAEDIVSGSPTYLRYNVIDMSLRGGLGDVVAGSKNVIIDSFTSEKMAVCKGPDCSVWLIVHRADTCVLQAFRVDPSGIHPPVISGFPSERYYTGIPGRMGAYLTTGMDITADGKLLVASRNISPQSLDLYDFNRNTGVFSNKRTLDSTSGSYHVQFSPDGSKLYTSSPLAQFDLSLLPSIAAVRASRYVIRDTNENSNMRIGPDNKIYHTFGAFLSSFVPHSIYCIDNPDVAGIACGFHHYMTLPFTNYPAKGFGLPVVVPDPVDTVYTRRDTSLCFSPDALLSARGLYSGYTWADGRKGRNIHITGPGKTWVRMRQACVIRIDTIDVYAALLDTVIRTHDTVICFSGPILIKAPVGRSWHWDDGDTNQHRYFGSGGIHWVSYYSGDCSFNVDTFRLVSSTMFDTTLRVLDTTVCLMSPVTLSAAPGYEYYKWQDGSFVMSRSISIPGTYWVSAVRNCTVLIDSFHVSAQGIDTSIYRMDTVICFSDKVTLSAIPGYTYYEWSDGGTSNSSEFRGDMVKWVIAHNKNCKIRIDTMDVRLINFHLSLPDRDTVCGERVVILDATTPDAGYLWQDGTAEPVYNVTQAGIFTIKVTVGPCTLQHAVEIIRRDFDMGLGNDQRLCEGSELVLETGTKGAGYLWQDGSRESTYNVTKSGTYSVEVTQEKCIGRDTVHVDVVRCSDCIAIPNAFTPNGDQHNDVFRPLLQCPAKSYSLKIFSRYGQQIFSADDPSESWDGSFNLQNLDLGTYYYLLKVHFDYPGAEDELFKGDIILLR